MLLFTMLFWVKYMKKTNLHRYVLEKQKYFGSLFKITVIFDTKQAVISKELATTWNYPWILCSNIKVHTSEKYWLFE